MAPLTTHLAAALYKEEAQVAVAGQLMVRWWWWWRGDDGDGGSAHSKMVVMAGMMVMVYLSVALDCKWRGCHQAQLSGRLDDA